MKMMFISFCCSRKGFRLFVQVAKQQAVWLSLNCINGKYLWALPTPTTFEKVDQTFIISCRNYLLNHNLPQILTKNHKKISTMRLMHRAFVYHSVTSLINILSLYLPFLLALASLNLSSSPSVIPLALAMA